MVVIHNQCECNWSATSVSVGCVRLQVRQKVPELQVVVEGLQKTVDVAGAAQIDQSSRVQMLVLNLGLGQNNQSQCVLASLYVYVNGLMTRCRIRYHMYNMYCA